MKTADELFPVQFDCLPGKKLVTVDSAMREIAKARREMIEDIANALLVACDEVEAAGEEADPIAIFKRCELKIRALMEKGDDKPKSTSDVLDPAGVEAALYWLGSQSGSMVFNEDIARNVITAYLKAAKGVSK